MKAFLTALLVTTVIAVGSNALLTGYFDFSSGSSFSSDAVRLN